MKATEEVIYVDSGVTLNDVILYKRVELEKSITITESQFDEAHIIVADKISRGCKGLFSDLLKIELGF